MAPSAAKAMGVKVKKPTNKDMPMISEEYSTVCIMSAFSRQPFAMGMKLNILKKFMSDLAIEARDEGIIRLFSALADLRQENDFQRKKSSNNHGLHDLSWVPMGILYQSGS